MSKKYKVKGGTTQADDPIYEAGYHYEETVGHIAQAMQKAGDKRKLETIIREIARDNHLEVRPGVKCTDKTPIKDIRIKAGQELILRIDTPIHPELYYECPKKRVPLVPAPEQEEFKTVRRVMKFDAAEGIPLAQFEPAPDGAVRNASGLQTFMAFYGKDPVDAAADRSKENSRVRGAALNPNNSEGAKFRGVKADVAANGLPGDERGITFMGRAGRGSRGDHGELNLKPSALVHLDEATGAELATNRRFPFKPEQNPRFMLDSNNQLRIVVDGHMTISDARRNDPFHAGFITDHTTATNLINQWNNTGRGQEVLTQWMGLQDAFKTVGGRFMSGSEPATVADAEKLLQFNVKLALHPISWSVDSRGVPAADPAVIQASQNAIFESPRFQSLPQAEQQRLHQQYDSLTPLMTNARALKLAAGDMSQWNRPLDEKIPERLVTKDTNIPQNYFDTFGRQKGHDYSREEKVELADRALRVMSRKADEASIQGPTEMDLRRGTALSLSTSRQSKEALQAGRSAWLGKFTEDAQYREDVAGYVAKTPEALQQWTDQLFHATRATGANSSILDYKSDAAADRDVSRISALLGGDKYKGKLDYYNGILEQTLNPLVHMGTIGMVSLGKGANQRRGLDKDFTDTVAARYADTTTIEKNGHTPHDNVVEALRQVAARAKTRNDLGDERASVPLTLSLSPTLNQQLKGNNGVIDPNYRTKIAGPVGSIFEDQEVANASLTGNASAQIEQGTEKKAFAAAGTVKQVDEATAAAAIAKYLETGKGTTIIGMKKSGFITTLDTRAAEEAKKLGSGILGVVATANNPGKVSQGETDRETTTKLAANSPLVFSLLTLDAMAGNAGLDKTSQQNLAQYVQNVDNGGEGRAGFSGYADRMKHHAKAIAAAGNDPEARTAAQRAAAADLSAYFALAAKAAPGSKESALPGLAVSRLAGQMAQDNNVSAAMDAMAGGPALAGLADNGTAATPSALVAGGGVSGTMNKADKADLLAALSGATAEGRASALRSWVAAHSAAPVAGSNAGLTLSNLTAAQTDALLAAANAGNTPDARVAGLTATLAGLPKAGGAAVVAGGVPADGKPAGTAPLAGSSALYSRLANPGVDVLAGLVAGGAITAEDRTQLLSFKAYPDEAARLAGVNAWMAGHIAGENAKTAHTGISAVELGKLLLTVVVVPGGDKSPDVIRGGVDDCIRGTCVVPPGSTPGILPNVPRIPLPRPGGI